MTRWARNGIGCFQCKFIWIICQFWLAFQIQKCNHSNQLPKHSWVTFSLWLQTMPIWCVASDLVFIENVMNELECQIIAKAMQKCYKTNANIWKCTKHKIKTFVTKNCKSSFSFLLDRFTVGCSSCWALWHEKEWLMIFNVCAKNARVSTPFTVSCSVWTCKHVT